ncbi:hypothetical protein M422DRAFT_204294 [Sphaerobolus stellatus SS14]|nr:hypothetical protein M422DRAFT_204294 [Sphaerobolus stellatus SS14]
MSAPETTTFSSSGQDVITRTLDIHPGLTNVPNPTNEEELVIVEELYEVEWTAEELLKGGYKQIALQFPDELLHVSVPIFNSLKKRLPDDVGLYVLADTSYGSCCVDEVAAQHVNADIVVHYGYSCLSKPSRLPVLYIFTKAKLDVKHAADALLRAACQGSDSPASRFILIPDVAYAHLIDDLISALKDSPLFPSDGQIFFNPIPRKVFPSSEASTEVPTLPPLDPEQPMDKTNQQSKSAVQSPPNSHRRYTLPPNVLLSSCTMLYIGPESLGLSNLLMTHPETTVISYDPTLSSPEAKVESIRTNRLLMKRYAVVQHARDADVIGIIVGTLGVASYLPLISNLRELIRRHKKKSYTLSVGKINPAKLGNFAEIECFVMVACPENSVIDTKEFYRPIVTPFELSLALNPKPIWPGNYILDFEHVMEQTHASIEEEGKSDDENDPDRPIFSLVTGKYRHSKKYGQVPSTPDAIEGGDSSLVLRNQERSLLASNRAAADFLQTRTFKGLEQRVGLDVPSSLEEGRSGIARGYQDDHPQEDGAK